MKARDPAPPPVSVTAFEDHDVIVPPHKLKKAVVRARPSHNYEPDPVARAEQALFELSSDFSQWMEVECARLDAARHAFAAGVTGKVRDELFRAAHDIKGEAATFGFPRIEPVAASLCRLIEHSPEPARIPLVLIDQHVDGIRAIVHRNVHGDSERKAQVLAERLRQVTEEFLLHENRHRPGYLDDVEAPRLAPEDPPG
jgi:HPt (histidine-containing phosphotransfer) domain-containing protein